ncbi:MAG TPA: DinB family protein [Gemmatimonadales bacterium]|nr:DinB family protein [Gemmatimonadales bacterium]
MSEFTSLLDETIEGWWDVRNGVIAEAENIPADKYDFRPVREVRNVREMLQHILEIAMMMTGELTRPDTNLRRYPWPKLLKHYASPAYEATTKAQLVKLLGAQLKDAEKKFRDAGELSLLQFHTRFDGKQGTKFAWWHHGIAQEEYHRGQLATYQRLMGLVPALTKAIQGG